MARHEPALEPALEPSLKTQEVASLLKVDERTVRAWADQGKLPCWKTPGGRRSFPASAVQQLAQELSFQAEEGVS